jgi:hypothetical protein
VVPKWEVERDTLVYSNSRVKQLYHLIASDRDRVEGHADNQRHHLWLTGHVQRRGEEVHPIGCRADRIEQSVTDAVDDGSKESDRRMPPARGERLSSERRRGDERP